MVRVLALVPAVVVLTACEELTDAGPGRERPAAETTGAATAPEGDAGGRPGRDGRDDDRGEDAVPAAPGWVLGAHPCVGNRTDALWFDGRDEVWVGCGSTAEGTGLYHSADGGASWAAVTGFFDTFRVSDLFRAADGRLYVAGIDTVSAARVVSFSPAGDLVEEFSAGDQVWSSFQVGGFRRTSTGLAVAESLTGAGAVSRATDADAWGDASGWWGTAGSYQILDLELHDDRFFGVGSTVGQPPTLYLPGDGPGFSMVPVEFQGFDGEFWGLAVDGAGVFAAGVNQDRDTGFLAWSGPDPLDLGAYHTLDVATLLPGEPTWMRGACRDGDTLVAVGEYSMEGEGLVLRSDDGGATWTDLTPAGAPPLHQCRVFADGGLAVAGADGAFGTWTP